MTRNIIRCFRSLVVGGFAGFKLIKRNQIEKHSMSNAEL